MELVPSHLQGAGMTDLSEKAIRANCPHCNHHSFALNHVLKMTENFLVVCDGHPLTEGHILIIPKAHLSCIGEYPPNMLGEFVGLYLQTKRFIESVYGSVSTFEHGIVGQTVFHSHIQMFPYAGPPEAIIPEGDRCFEPIPDISALRGIYERDGRYLFFSIGRGLWIADPSIGVPGLFRERFGKALGNEVRSDWKRMHDNEALMEEGRADIGRLVRAWQAYHRNLHMPQEDRLRS
jgi:diadenosine tetraphosphate (Ap4A) HIT family hydrolase